MTIVHADDFVPAVDTVPSNTTTTYTLDSGDSGGDVTLSFGTTLNETLKWNSSLMQFDLSDDLNLAGGITTSAGATIGGGIINLNASSNFAVNIGTGTSTGAVTIGGNANTVAIDGTNFDLTTAGAVTLTGNLALSGDANEGLSGGGLADCDNANNQMSWDATTNKFGCSTNSKDSGVFVDATPAAMTDTDTTQLFNDATKPNIVTNFAGSNVLVSVSAYDTAASGNDDEFDAIRVVRTTNGVDPSCTTSPQVGPILIGGFVTSTSQPWSVSGTFLDSPGVAGTIKYTVCTSTASTGTVDNVPNSITVSLVEIGS